MFCELSTLGIDGLMTDNELTPSFYGPGDKCFKRFCWSMLTKRVVMILLLIDLTMLSLWD